MSIICNWTVNNMKHLISNGGVIVVDWSCTAVNQISPAFGTPGTVEYIPAKYGTQSSFYGGQTEFKEPDSSSPEFVPYNELTQEIVLDWIFSTLGDKKQEIETDRIAKVEKQLQPIVESGLPWQ